MKIVGIFQVPWKDELCMGKLPKYSVNLDFRLIVECTKQGTIVGLSRGRQKEE